MVGLVSHLIDIGRMIYLIFLRTAPFILLGLFLAGWLKVLIREEYIGRFFGQRNLRSALYAALFGLPLPICSCGIVPLVMGLREKGASREARLSLLISTPETSVDTVILTWGLLGPVMAIVRPLAAFSSALFAAVLSIAERTDRSIEENSGPWRETKDALTTETDTACEGCSHHSEDGYHVVGLAGFWSSLKASVRRILPGRLRSKAPGAEETGSPHEMEPAPPIPLRVLTRDATRYGFVEMLDHISYWFVLGILLAGVLAALLPDNWVDVIPGGVTGSMLFMLLISVPLYICAAKSTPIAATLIATGLSPGAALVFLLAGPATNMSSIVILNQIFGRRFLGLYLSAIVLVSLAFGWILNAFLQGTGITVSTTITQPLESTLWNAVSIGSALLLLCLLAASFRRLDWNAKRENIRGFGQRFLDFLGLLKPVSPESSEVSSPTAFNRGKAFCLLFSIALLLYGLSGLYRVPPGSAGYKVRLGRLVEKDIPPGLRYHLPPPFEKAHVFPVRQGQKTDLGFRTDMRLLIALRKRFEITTTLTGGWHNLFTGMNMKPDESFFLMGDENQLEAKFAFHYRIRDPEKYYFNYAKNRDLVLLAAESVSCEYLAKEQIDHVLSYHREQIDERVREGTQSLLDRYDIGVELIGVYLVDLHPPVRAVGAFRDVASAMEELQTRIHEAYGKQAGALPVARGEAEKIIAGAEAEAFEIVAQSKGRSESFSIRSKAFKSCPDATHFRMYVETMERSLPGTEKIILPPEMADRRQLRLWSGNPGEIPGMDQTGKGP